jgi:EAL domain-containing protein (putative c-di-GMP-specific phosphodiesterase class I)
VAALLSLPFAAPSLAGRVRQVLDGLMIAASLLLASWSCCCARCSHHHQPARRTLFKDRVDAQVVDDVRQALEASGLPPSSLVLEMTESVLLDDSETVLDILRQLKQLGARLAIDDFGTGYSSLSYLHRFPVDILKIDRSFVERLNRTFDNAELAWTVVRLGQSLQLVTVAEGVEDSAQFLTLRRMGCDVGQGYYFGHPMESQDMERLLGDDVAATTTAAASD